MTTSFTPYHLKAIFYLIFLDEHYRDQFFPILSPDVFILDKELYLLAKAYWSFKDKYNFYPTESVFVEEVFNQQGSNIGLFNSPPSADTMSLLFEYFITNIVSMETPAVSYISDITLRVIKLINLHKVINKHKTDINNGSVDTDAFAQELLECTTIVDTTNVGINALENLDKRTDQRLSLVEAPEVVPINIPEFSGYIEDGGVPPGTLSFWLAATGVGKCLDPNTEVMLYSGRLKRAKDIVIGDILMGADSSPRHVLSTTFGVGEMFRITPTKGQSFICNDVHVLTLVNTLTNEIIDIPLNEYLLKHATFKHLHKLYIPDMTLFPLALCQLLTHTLWGYGMGMELKT
jgi:hypothetical protein